MATFVLVHGTTSGGWVWQDIVRPLRHAGHEVHAATLTGLGDRSHLLTREVGLTTHVTDIVNVLRFEELHDVILVGHSYAGMVIAGVADQEPERIRELVYFDALVPEDGESAVDVAGPATRRDMETRVREAGNGWQIPVMRGSNDLGTRNTPHPWKSWREPVSLHNSAATKIPATYIRFSADKQPGAQFQLAMETSWQRARTRGWRLVEVETVHQILPDPRPKAAVLLQLFG